MRKQIFTLFVALVATVAVQAQQISVVSPSGATTLYRTLSEAINGAALGSVVYLPGGGFTIADDVKITKKLTIIGIGHKTNGDNADGSTIISGNLWFNEGSSNSAVLGCYITGDVNIGEGDAEVNNVLVKYCNLNSVQVKNSNCTETLVNQNYIRSRSYCSKAEVKFTNNICYAISSMEGGLISNNIITANSGSGVSDTPCYDVDCSLITDNVFINTNKFYNSYIHHCDNSQISGNLDHSNIDRSDWNNVFVKYQGISPNSDFHFKDEYKQYESQVGIYAGSGFNDKQMAPVPYITFKDVDEETDAAGKLKVRIRVKASE